MAVDLRRYGIRVDRVLIHRNNTFEFLGDELPEGVWLWKTILGGTLELYRSGPPPRKVQPWEVLALLLGCIAVLSVFLVVLPFLAALVGVLAPIAAVVLLVRYVLRQRAR